MAFRLDQIVLLVVLVSACRESAWTPMGSADLVLSQMKLGGVAAVAKRIDADPKFGESVMNGIATGDSSWIEVAKQLVPASAAAEASLVIALASALPNQPRRVLPLLGRKYALEDVCGIPFLEADSSAINAYRDSAITALSSVRDTSLIRSRDACARKIEEARTTKLARIDPAYVIKNKPKPLPARRTRRR